jgi:hypothetical protein
MRPHIMMALGALAAAGAAAAQTPPGASDSWRGRSGDGGYGSRHARREREAIVDRAQADRARLEQDARLGAASSSSDAQANCAAAVNKRLASGRTEAAKRKLESCRRRLGSSWEPTARSR